MDTNKVEGVSGEKTVKLTTNDVMTTISHKKTSQAIVTTTSVPIDDMTTSQVETISPVENMTVPPVKTTPTVKNITTPPMETTSPVETTPPAETTPPVETTPPAETTPAPVDDIPLCETIISWRFVMALLLHFSLVVASLPIFSLTIAVICMVAPRTQGNLTGNFGNQNVTGILDNQSLHTDGLQNTFSYNVSHEIESTDAADSYEFDWDPSTISLLLTAPSFANFAGPLFTDFVRRKLGSKTCMVIFIGVCAVLTVLCPTAARVSPYLLMACMVPIGLARSTGLVVTGDMMAWWCPVSDRVFLNSVIVTGFSSAGIFANAISGFACSIPIDNGWPFIFYIAGGIVVVFLVLWCVLSSKTPDEHPFISKKEQELIISLRTAMDKNASKLSSRPPFKKIFKSRPVLAVIIMISCFMWVVMATLTYQPMFYNKALGFSVAETGVLSAAVSIIRIFSNYAWVGYSKFLVSTKRFTTNRVRKIVLMTGFFTAAFLQFTIAAVMMIANRWVIYSLFVARNIFACAGSSVMGVLALDMAPRYAGTINAIQQTVSNLFGLTAPLLMGLITPDNTLEQWRVAMSIFGVITLIGLLSFIFLGDATLQPWAQTETAKNYLHEHRQDGLEAGANKQLPNVTALRLKNGSQKQDRRSINSNIGYRNKAFCDEEYDGTVNECTINRRENFKEQPNNILVTKF